MRQTLFGLFLLFAICSILFLISIIFEISGVESARCESMGGVYGGGKCFVNGFEVDNQ